MAKALLETGKRGENLEGENERLKRELAEARSKDDKWTIVSKSRRNNCEW